MALINNSRIGSIFFCVGFFFVNYEYWENTHQTYLHFSFIYMVVLYLSFEVIKDLLISENKLSELKGKNIILA